MNNEDSLNVVFKISNSIDYKKIKLDEYGSFIFLQIDGKKTVEEIGENLESEYGDATHPLYERLTMYLNHIYVNCNYIERIN